MIINAFIKQQTLTLSRKSWVAGSRDYVGLHVIYQTADWAGLSVTAFFGDEADPKNLYTVDVVDGEIPPDKHLNLSAGKWKIWMVGLDIDGTQKVSTQAETITVDPTGCSCDDFPEVPPSYAEDFERRLSRLERDGVGPGGGGGGPSDAVRYGPQELTEDEKRQARENIGAGAVADISAQVQQATSAAGAAQQSQRAAATSASNASQYASTAAGAAAGAGTSAQEAAASAESAAGSASAAAGSAQSASGSAQSASGSADTANAAAGRAEAAESGANSAAETARGHADSAAESAQSASTQAGNALQSATTATEQAEAATSEADRAKREADRAEEATNSAKPGTGGVKDHADLTGREKLNQHPISAITGLQDALDGKQPAGNYAKPEDIPKVPAWAMKPQKPTYTAKEVEAEPAGTSASTVSAHNVSRDAHNDIRDMIAGLTSRLDAFFNSDDQTLDQLSEIVAYIKSNKSLLDAVTTNKVNVTDIVNNLTTNVATKPLSAAQGVELKRLIDAINIPNVPEWAMQTQKPSYTAQEVGALPEDTKIPKSAYQDAKDGGYTGIEAEFKSGLAQAVQLFEKDTSAWTPVQEFDGATANWTPKTIWQPDGTTVSTQYTQKFFASPKIKIPPDCEYELIGINGSVMVYDESGKNGEKYAGSTPAQALKIHSKPYQRFMGINTVITGSWTPQKVTVTRTTISKEEIAALPGKSQQFKTLYGKEVVCFGDSLFGMHRGDTSAPAYAAKVSGATVHNVGFGGCWMSQSPNLEFREFSMSNLADAAASGDWSAQDSATGVPGYFPEQLAVLKAIDFSKVDFAVIHYGTNDWYPPNPAALDNPENPMDRTTMCGALRYSIDRLQGAFPQLQIYISAPCYRTWTENGVTTTSDDKVNANGLHLYDVGEAFAAVAKQYNLPVIDSYHGLNINRSNWSEYLEDGTHHNNAGRIRFGTYIGQCLTAGANGCGFYGAGGVSKSEVQQMINASIGTALEVAY